jgi:hypothetical protein
MPIDLNDQLQLERQRMNDFINTIAAAVSAFVVVPDVFNEAAIEAKPAMQPTTNEPSRGRARWSSAEDADLGVLCKYLDDRSVAGHLHRTPKAIEARRLALYFKRH